MSGAASKPDPGAGRPTTLAYERDRLASVQPGMFLKGISLLAMSVSLWAIGGSIRPIINPSTHGEFMGALLLVPLGSVLAVGHYLAVFRKRRREAALLAGVYSVLARFSAFATVVTIGEIFAAPGRPIGSYIGLVAILFGATALLCFVCIVQWRWWQALRRHEEQG